MKIVSIFAIISIMLFSCAKKERTITIEGQVDDPSFNQKANGVKVLLKSAGVQSGVYTSTYLTIGEATTGSDGKFKMELTVAKSSGYRLNLSKSDYFSVQRDIATDVLEAEDNYTIHFNIYPKATIHLEVKNTTPQGNDDAINYHFTNIDEDCTTCCNNEMTYGVGPLYQNATECELRGNKMLKLEWVVKKNGNQKLYQDSIWIEPFITNYYSINF
ncbi:MAG: hypothetical protein JXR34_02965 [Bacteroidales bacterium]|nr:hypothetical protein [Bacteroidales bacterium]